MSVREPARRRSALRVLEAVDLTKTYRRGPEEVGALRGASFSLGSGEVVALVGPSGSGKTTVLNLVAGWEQPDRGLIRWSEPLGDPAMPSWEEISFVPQDLALVEELTIGENVELPLMLARASERAASARAAALLHAFGLIEHADRMPNEVSLGEQQRAAVARAMICVPRLLLADEPTGHQDASWAKGVIRGFRWLASRGTACLLATHSTEFLTEVDRVLAIRDGAVADAA